MNSIGFDSDGHPCDYVDENGIYMYYHGKNEDGSDNWYNYPPKKN